jgi:hypothetical protein
MLLYADENFPLRLVEESRAFGTRCTDRLSRWQSQSVRIWPPSTDQADRPRTRRLDFGQERLQTPPPPASPAFGHCHLDRRPGSGRARAANFPRGHSGSPKPNSQARSACPHVRIEKGVRRLYPMLCWPKVIPVIAPTTMPEDSRPANATAQGGAGRYHKRCSAL